MRSRSSGLITSGRSGPSTIFSRASRKSFWRTSSCSRRAAKSAASFTRFLMSAPESPGVDAASSSRSTPRASGTPLVWTSRIASRPTLSGRFTVTRRSKRPGLRSALSSTSGWLVAAKTITPSLEEKPSISVRIWFRVCSCSLDPPTSPRHGPSQERLSRPRGSHQEHALRCRPAEAGVSLGVLEEVHYLYELVLGLLYAGYVLEGDLRLLLLIVAAGAAATDASEGAAHAAALPLGTPVEPDVAPDQQKRRTEGE